MDEQSMTLQFEFPEANDSATVTVSGFENPQIALLALKSAGSDESLQGLIDKMKEQAQQ